MKKIIRNILAICIALAIMLCVNIPAHADGLEKYKPVTSNTTYRSVLTDSEKDIYDQIKTDVILIMSGEKESTIIDLDMNKIDDISDIDIAKVINAFMLDDPYGVFWSTGEFHVYNMDDQAKSIGFEVRQSFQKDHDEYTVDLEKVATVRECEKNAEEFIKEAKGENDAETLQNYYESITDRYLFNAQTPKNGEDEKLTPWQMVQKISKTTKSDAAREMYAKDFKYLCDRTMFKSILIDVLTVEGTINKDNKKVVILTTEDDKQSMFDLSSVSSKDIVWNIVTMNDGKQYNIDLSLVTANASTAFQEGFLRGYREDSTEQKLIVPSNYGKYDMAYVLSDTLKDIFDDLDLKLADHDFVDKHENTETINAKAATCTSDGYTGDIRCVDCGKILKNGESIPALGHKPEVSDAKDADCEHNGYTGDTICSTCGTILKVGYVIPTEGHKLETRNAKDATCTESGYTGDKVCTVCGKTVEQGSSIAAKDHDIYINGKKDATCEQDGYSGDEMCRTCGKVIRKGETTKATGHTPELKNAKKTSCKEAGYTGDKVCSVCNNVLETGKAIAKLDHKAGAQVKEHEVAATCQKNGSYDLDTYCSVCGELLKKETISIDKVAHSWGAWRTVQESTQTRTGLQEHTCKVCGARETEPLPLLSNVTYSCTKGGNGSYAKDSGLAMPFTFKRNPDDKDIMSHLTKVSIDDVDLAASDYNTFNGSTNFTLNADYLKTLDNGEHVLTLTFSEAKVSVRFTVKETGDATPTTAPTTQPSNNQQGNNTVKPTTTPGVTKVDVTQSRTRLNTGLWILLLCASLALAATIVVYLIAKKRAQEAPYEQEKGRHENKK